MQSFKRSCVSGGYLSAEWFWDIFNSRVRVTSFGSFTEYFDPCWRFSDASSVS